MYGISGLALEWFKDYLRNRTAQVLIGIVYQKLWASLSLYHRDHVQA